MVLACLILEILAFVSIVRGSTLPIRVLIRIFTFFVTEINGVFVGPGVRVCCECTARHKSWRVLVTVPTLGIASPVSSSVGLFVRMLFSKGLIRWLQILDLKWGWMRLVIDGLRDSREAGSITLTFV